MQASGRQLARSGSGKLASGVAQRSRPERDRTLDDMAVTTRVGEPAGPGSVKPGISISSAEAAVSARTRRRIAWTIPAFTEAPVSSRSKAAATASSERKLKKCPVAEPRSGRTEPTASDVIVAAAPHASGSSWVRPAEDRHKSCTAGLAPKAAMAGSLSAKTSIRANAANHTRMASGPRS